MAPLLERLLNKLPLSQNGKVAFGTMVCLSICAYPVFSKKTKPGHDLFSSEKPQDVFQKEVEDRRARLKTDE
ncbi:TPA: hypothetical protein N0F65_008610 [Lagenidium giganteum]|uniref:Uncharacterized protein n=1 Tax=Lagenidium giganteum TaxID=4803 RepID=A0AAV2Z3A8_9STRA|nr:TPA: hypothetical protein N0F65_008610 [Lagenidium giganteum]